MRQRGQNQWLTCGADFNSAIQTVIRIPRCISSPPEYASELLILSTKVCASFNTLECHHLYFQSSEYLILKTTWMPFQQNPSSLWTALCWIEIIISAIERLPAGSTLACFVRNHDRPRGKLEEYNILFNKGLRPCCTSAGTVSMPSWDATPASGPTRPRNGESLRTTSRCRTSREAPAQM